MISVGICCHSVAADPSQEISASAESPEQLNSNTATTTVTAVIEAPSDPGTGGGPQTGDTFRQGLYLAIILISAGVIFILTTFLVRRG